MQRHQELKPHHRIQRVNHAQAQLQLIANNPDFKKNLVFSDEAHFAIHGEVNHQNFRYWSDKNPGFLKEVPLHSPRVTVWAAIGCGSVIGPVFVDGTINGNSYLTLLQNEFLPKAQQLPNFHSLVFMQDGAPPHWATAVRNWLSDTLPGRWMGRGSPNLPWPANSPDLTPCDFFLWGYLKSRVYRTQPEDLQQLKARITHEFQQLPMDFVQRSIDSYEHRLYRCIEVNGAHVE